ncbi:hypothetical protein EV174_003206 [Coemansia sp. RSA 2320]|nr:hypothetical protein EV174_003206 [Coemansia sp. RSA 2320]
MVLLVVWYVLLFVAAGLLLPSGVGARPIAAVRARHYAQQAGSPAAGMEQGADVHDGRHKLRRLRSVDASRTAVPERRGVAAAVGAGIRQQSEQGMRLAATIGLGVRQQSELGMRPGVRRAEMSAAAAGAEKRQAARSISPLAAVAAGESRIPRAPSSSRTETRVRDLHQQVRLLEEAKADLVEALTRACSHISSLAGDKEQLEADAAQRTQRMSRLEAELAAEREASAALRAKAAALEGLLAARSEAEEGGADPIGSGADLRETIGSVVAACTAHRPRAEFSAAVRRDISRVEAYVSGGGGSSNDPKDRKDRKSRNDHSDRKGRGARRRSSMLFADLVQASSGGACERCAQLGETMQCLEADNDYYRAANAKLRDAVNDTASRHNALVRIFEVERARRRDLHAARLADASRAASHRRAMLDAADGGPPPPPPESPGRDALARHLASALHIAQAAG